MAEDIGDFEAEIRAATGVRTSVCSVCEWLESRDDAARWDRIFAGPVKIYGHKAIWKAMRDRGFLPASSKPIESHRQRQHRVG
jgi:hypothetical protein